MQRRAVDPSISGPEVGVLKTVVTTNPLCLRKLWIISSVPVIVSKCRYVALHFFYENKVPFISIFM